MKTKYIILALAIFIAPAAMAQEYFAKRDLGGGSAMYKQASHCSHLAPSFAKLRYYFGDNSPIVQKQPTPRTGRKKASSQSINLYCLNLTSVTPTA